MVLVLSDPRPTTESMGDPLWSTWTELPSSLITATRVSGCQGLWATLVSPNPSCLSAVIVRCGLLSLRHGSFSGCLVVSALSPWDLGEEILQA